MMNFWEDETPVEDGLSKRLVKNYFLPILIQLAIIAIMILLFMNVVSIGNEVMPSVSKGVEQTSPTAGRLFYTIFSFIMFMLMAVLASLYSKNNYLYKPYYMGFLSGTFLWQSIGEAVWHLGVYDEGVFVNFTRLESVEVMPLVLPVLLLIGYGFYKKIFNWGIQIVILAFLCNWLGHFITIGMGPFWEKIIGGETWNFIVAFVVGGALTVFGFYWAIRKFEYAKSQLLGSMATFIGISVIAFSFIH